MAEPRSFSCLDTFTITGRGTVHVVALPDDLWSAPEAPHLIGQKVRIDGVTHLVRGVEWHCVPWRPRSPTFRNVGLLVEARSDV